MNFFRIVFISALLCFSTYAMDPAREHQPENSLVVDLAEPTIGDYSTILIVGDDINGWGNLKGSVHTWLQATANQNRVSNTQNQLLEDLPFFIETLNPVVASGDMLQCDYSLPVQDEDHARGTSTFSLTRKATQEQIEFYRVMAVESSEARAMRVKQWRENLEKLKVSNLVDSKIFPNLKLHTFNAYFEPSSNYYTLRAKLSDARKIGNICFMSADGLKIRNVTLCQNRTIHFDPPQNAIARDISDLNKPAHLYFNQGSYTLTITDDIVLPSIMFDINGDLEFKITKISLNHTLCGCVGNLVFRSNNDKCLIKKIEIQPANNNAQMCICADIDFSENPKFTIECSNANSICVKFRKK